MEKLELPILNLFKYTIILSIRICPLRNSTDLMYAYYLHKIHVTPAGPYTCIDGVYQITQTPDIRLHGAASDA